MFSDVRQTCAQNDSIPNNVPKNQSGINDIVEYSAKDSMVFNIPEQKVFLYGNAEVSYQQTKLNAAFIMLDLKKNEVFAEGRLDSAGNLVQKPVFEENGQSFSSETMRYNFDTKKGKITHALTQEGDGYIHGEQVKTVSDDILYIYKGKYTTCNLEENPHFYIQASKLKIIKDDKIITGPAYLAIADIPTPLAVPFGYFPNQKERSSGIVLPTYGQSPGLGFFLNSGGYYWSVNDYMDVSFLGDIYSRGSWGSRVVSNYKKRYKFNGGVDVSYSVFKRGEKDFPDYSETKNFFVKWRHNQDPKARPNSTFSADVNAGSANNFRNNFNTTSQNYLSNQFKSNITYFLKIPNSPFSLNINANHNQNNVDTTVNITLPQATVNMVRIFPFKRKNPVGKTRWYEKIGMSYTGNLVNRLTAKEYELKNPQTYERVKNGMQHTLPVQTSFKMLKYIQINPVATYSEKWYLETYQKYWDSESKTLITDTLRQFKSTRSLTFNANATTKIYGMYTFKSRKILAMRHVLTPSLSFNYQPDIDKRDFYTSVVDSLGNTAEYSFFENTVFGGGSKTEAGNIGINLLNSLEMKIKTNKDSSESIQKVSLLDGLRINTTYNIFADSLNLSPLTLSVWTTVLNNFKLQVSATYNPYSYNNNSGVNYNEWLLNTNGKIATLTSAQIGLSFNLKSHSKSKKKISGNANPDELKMIQDNPEAYVDFTVPWNIFVRYSLRYSNNYVGQSVTNSMMLNGDLKLTPKWKIGYTTGYDFTSKKVTYTTLHFYRDLHCWEMNFNIVPFGNRKSYTIDINVKSPVLQDLKLSRKRNWYDFQ